MTHEIDENTLRVLRELFRGAFGSEPNTSPVRVLPPADVAERQLQVLHDIRDRLQALIDEIRDIRNMLGEDD